MFGIFGSVFLLLLALKLLGLVSISWFVVILPLLIVLIFWMVSILVAIFIVSK